MPGFQRAALRTFLQRRTGPPPVRGRSGPGYFNIDLALFRNIAVRKEVTLQLRMEALNALNHASFYLESRLQDINSTDFGLLRHTWGPREIQVSARLEF